MKGDEQNTERDIRTIKVETYSTKVVNSKEDTACKNRKLGSFLMFVESSRPQNRWFLAWVTTRKEFIAFSLSYMTVPNHVIS
jgi:hypothetical protein